MTEDQIKHMVNRFLGAAEREVGRYVYRRIEALMDAKAGTPEAAEFAYLARIAESVEEYGEDACADHELAAYGAPYKAVIQELADALRPFAELTIAGELPSSLAEKYPTFVAAIQRAQTALAAMQP